MPVTELVTEAELIDRLRNGDEGAFTWLVDTYSPALKRLALGFVAGEAVAEEGFRNPGLPW